MTTIVDKHLDFVIRTKKKISLQVYTKYIFKKKMSEDELEKLDIVKWHNINNPNSLRNQYIKRLENGYTKSFSSFYLNK